MRYESLTTITIVGCLIWYSHNGSGTISFRTTKLPTYKFVFRTDSLFPLSLKSERDDEALIHFWKKTRKELGRCQKYSANGTVIQGASVPSIPAMKLFIFFILKAPPVPI